MTFVNNYTMTEQYRQQKFELFYKKYSATTDEAQQYAVLKDFTLGLSLDELLAWNNFIDEKWQKLVDKSKNSHITDEDRVWFRQQFAKFDALENTFRPLNAEK